MIHVEQLLDAGLVPVREAAEALGIPEKRLVGFVLRNELRDPIGGWRDGGMAKHSPQHRAAALTSADGVLRATDSASVEGAT